MHNLGGLATLGQLYRAALKIPGPTWKTKTPAASIRRIVQLDKRFFKIRPGLWALEERRKSIPFLEEAKEDAPKSEQEKFNHSYYQGLVVEIGNLKSFDTYVPPQDKNQMFLNVPLKEIASTAFHEFTYQSVTRYAKTVDVIWFNERKLPYAFIEVEHSTDIYNSLRKFVELQDFYADFRIVAPSYRKLEFEDKRRGTPYRDVVDRASFWSYERVEKEYEKLSELAALQLS
ncbi:hypothetical protein BH24DEI2_BH24DEI2_14640 [soil metagenome]